MTSKPFNFARGARNRAVALATAGLSLGCGSAVEDVEQLGTVEQAQVIVRDIRLKVYQVEGGFNQQNFTTALNTTNAIFASAFLRFVFDPATDLLANPGGLSCSDDTGLESYGDTQLGSVALFHCPSRSGGVGSFTRNMVRWSGSADTLLAHELGHYFGLEHIFTDSNGDNDGWVADEDHLTADLKSKNWHSVESCIKSFLNGTSRPAHCPPHLASAAAIRDALLSGDPYSDTGPSLQLHPDGVAGPCTDGATVPLNVQGPSGNVNLTFAPVRSNIMGYYKHCAIPMSLSAQQSSAVRNAALYGLRAHLVAKPMYQWDLLMSDANGWNAAKHYQTIRFEDVSNDGKGDLCGRGVGGILCGTSSGHGFATPTVWQSAFNDTNGWGSVQYYSTIRFPNVSGTGGADVCGRGSGGIVCAKSTGTGFGAATVWSADFSDGNGWNQEKHYATLDFPKIDSNPTADVCGRGTQGILCAVSNGTSLVNLTNWNNSFSDANGWNQAIYYRTIRYPNVNGSGGADVCGRGSDGVYCATSNGSAFTGTSRWTTEFNNANGWNQEKYYRTIQFPDLNGDGKADICGRGVNGMVCGISNGSSFTNVSLWTNIFSDANGWGQAKYYNTITFADIDGDTLADVCGRGIDGVVCAYSSGVDFGFDFLYALAPNDADGWGAAQYYSTLRFANVDGDTRPELCGRSITGVICE